MVMIGQATTSEIRIRKKKEDLNYSGITEWPAAWRAAHKKFCNQAIYTLYKAHQSGRVMDFPASVAAGCQAASESA